MLRDFLVEKLGGIGSLIYFALSLFCITVPYAVVIGPLFTSSVWETICWFLYFGFNIEFPVIASVVLLILSIVALFIHFSFLTLIVAIIVVANAIYAIKSCF